MDFQLNLPLSRSNFTHGVLVVKGVHADSSRHREHTRATSGCKIINDLENRFSPSALNRGVPLFSLMRTEAVQKLVGRPVKDTCGRDAGYVVGFSVDAGRGLEVVGTGLGNGQLTQGRGSRVGDCT